MARAHLVVEASHWAGFGCGLSCCDDAMGRIRLLLGPGAHGSSTTLNPLQHV